MPHKFDVSRVAILEDEGRKEFLPAEEILRKVGVREGVTLADIGCGTGYFSIPASKLVGLGGVYAIDVQAEMLELLRKKAKNNIRIIESTEDAIPLRDEIVDIAFMGAVLHELEGLGTLREAYRILRRGGNLAVVDWRKEEMEAGPPLEERLTLEEAKMMIGRAGFNVREAFDVPPYHYGIIAGKD